jgi:uncharacterized membrane protein YGL010W
VVAVAVVAEVLLLEATCTLSHTFDIYVVGQRRIGRLNVFIWGWIMPFIGIGMHESRLRVRVGTEMGNESKSRKLPSNVT